MMPKRSSSIVAELLTLVVAVGLIFAGIEIYLRHAMTNKAKPYEGIETIPEVTDAYFELTFLEQYATKKVWFTADFDPQLGWDYQIAANRVRGGRKIGPKEAGTLRVIALGDSFTWGIDVDDHECYPYLLGKVLRSAHGREAEVLNMGVGSYGIDQALMKFYSHGQKHRPDVVVLGIFPHDYDRTRLSFYSYSKPLFRYDGASGKYVLDNVPVPPPKEMYDALARKYDRTESYAFVFVKNRLWKLFGSVLSPGDPNRYFSETDRLVEYLLANLKNELDKTGAKLLIVHIPRGEAFESDQALSRGKSERQTTHLKALYEKLRIPHVDLLEALPRRGSLATIYRDYYVHRPDGSIAHFTPKGNAEVAKIIAEQMKAGGMLKGGGS